MKFTDSFWGPANDPMAGMRKLHEQLAQDTRQVEELIFFINQRITAEDIYQAKLAALSKLNNAENRNQSDSLITSIFKNYKRELLAVSASHKSMSDSYGRVLPTLQRFVDDAKKFALPQKDALEIQAKKVEKLAQEVRHWKDWYFQKSKDAIEAERKEAPTEDEPLESLEVMVNMGDREFSVDEFNEVLVKMQQHIDPKEVKFLLTTYRECYEGSDLATFLQQKLGLTESNSTLFMNELLHQGYVRPVSGRASIFVPTNYYQWKRTSLALQNEPLYKKLQREAEKSEFEYKKAVKNAEAARLSFDAMCVEYMYVVQKMMLERVNMLRQAFKTCVEYELIPTSTMKSIHERVNIFLETLDPEKEIQLILERDKFCSKPPATNIFYHYSKGPVEAVFGVDLELYTARIGRRVPPVLRTCLSYLEDVFATMNATTTSASADTKHDELDIWIEPSFNLTAIHNLRSALTSGRLGRKTIRKHPPEIIVGVVKLFLLEMPVSLVTDDIYDALKLLYLSKADDSSGMRLNSIRSLLATLPTSHFHTLSFLIRHWMGLFSPLTESHPRLTEFANAVGPLILRPETETSVTSHDKHQARLVKDLLLNYAEVIPSDILSPANSNEIMPIDGDPAEFVSDNSDYESEPDETASTRALYDGPDRFKRGQSSNSINSFSAFSAYTKRTGYSLTIATNNTEDSASIISSSGLSSAAMPSASSSSPYSATISAIAEDASHVLGSARLSNFGTGISSWMNTAPDQFKNILGSMSRATTPSGTTSFSFPSPAPNETGSGSSPSTPVIRNVKQATTPSRHHSKEELDIVTPTTTTTVLLQDIAAFEASSAKVDHTSLFTLGEDVAASPDLKPVDTTLT